MHTDKKPKHIWAVLYTLVLVLFSAYVLLDTFVIEHIYEVVENTNETDTEKSISTSTPDTTDNNEEETTENTNEPVITDTSYKDDNIEVTITESKQYNSTIYIADVVVSDIKYLKTAFANNSYGKNITAATSSIASDNNAILAINGDFYGARNGGYVLRNGKLYRGNGASSYQEDLLIKNDGSFELFLEGNMSAYDLENYGALQVLSFGPSLINNNLITVSADDEVGKAMSSNPRTAIGIIDNLHYVFLVADGRTSESAGLSLYQMANLMKSLGVTTAYNLDGGGSSTMCFMGNVVNKPTTNGKLITERAVSDIVYIGY